MLSKTTNINAALLDLLIVFVIYMWNMFSPFLIISGIIVLIMSQTIKNTAKRYQKYINLIINDKVDDINTIVDKMGLKREKVLSELYTLIDKRFLENYIIEEQNKLNEKQFYTRTIKCPNCGANNLIESKVGQCNYCRSYIE